MSDHQHHQPVFSTASTNSPAEETLSNAILETDEHNVSPVSDRSTITLLRPAVIHPLGETAVRRSRSPDISSGPQTPSYSPSKVRLIQQPEMNQDGFEELKSQNVILERYIRDQEHHRLKEIAAIKAQNDAIEERLRQDAREREETIKRHEETILEMQNMIRQLVDQQIATNRKISEHSGSEQDINMTDDRAPQPSAPSTRSAKEAQSAIIDAPKEGSKPTASSPRQHSMDIDEARGGQVDFDDPGVSNSEREDYESQSKSPVGIKLTERNTSQKVQERLADQDLRRNIAEPGQLFVTERSNLEPPPPTRRKETTEASSTPVDSQPDALQRMSSDISQLRDSLNECTKLLAQAIPQQPRRRGRPQLQRERRATHSSEDDGDNSGRKKEVQEQHDIRVAYCKEIRGIFSRILNIKTDNGIVHHITADARDIARFESDQNGIVAGPTLSNLHFDLSHASSEWNHAALRILVSKFKEEEARKKEHLRLAVMEDDYIMDLMKARLGRLILIWRRAQPKVNADGRLETSQEVKSRLEESRLNELDDGRRRRRRLSKYNQRAAICEAMLVIKQDEPPAPEVWKWLLEVVQKLGNDGMSSESSDTGSTGTVYRVTVLLWRRADVTKLMHYIDERRQFSHAFDTRGHGSHRLRTNIPSKREAVKNLPHALYEEEWFQGLKKYHQETLSHLVDMDPQDVHILNGNNPDLIGECKAYEQAIEDAGGIELLLGGIGDGHIAFNEPGSSLTSRTL